ncbi:MAG: phage holin family protein [Deltaproteobacteria bacterium]
MNFLKDIGNFWQVKVLTGLFITLFSPVQFSFFVLIILIVIDTLTGTAQACKFKRFSSNGLRKAVNKIVMYSISIITARLLEMGILYFFETFLISQFIIGFLIFTEVISVIENLVLLGVPIPKNFISVLLQNIKMLGLENVIRQSIDDYSESKEIEEIINYQLPAIRNQQMRKLIEIEFEGWSKVILFIKRSVEDEREASDDMVYYKTMAYIETVKKECDEKRKDMNLSKNCIEEFDKWHIQRKELFLQNIKNICYAIKEIKDKKKELVDRIMILIYQTVLDAHKSESQFKC